MSGQENFKKMLNFFSFILENLEGLMIVNASKVI